MTFYCTHCVTLSVDEWIAVFVNYIFETIYLFNLMTSPQTSITAWIEPRYIGTGTVQACFKLHKRSRKKISNYLCIYAPRIHKLYTDYVRTMRVLKLSVYNLALIISIRLFHIFPCVCRLEGKINMLRTVGNRESPIYYTDDGYQIVYKHYKTAVFSQQQYYKQHAELVSGEITLKKCVYRWSAYRNQIRSIESGKTWNKKKYIHLICRTSMISL